MRSNRLMAAPAVLLACAAWVNAEAADIFNGRDVYEMHCETCHGSDGVSMDPGTPDFSRGESLYMPDTELVRRLREGSAMKPSYRGLLTDEEMRDVIAYVRTLQR